MPITQKYTLRRLPFVLNHNQRRKTYLLTDNKVGNDVSAAIRAYYDVCSSLFSNSFRSKMFLLSISYFRLNVDCKTLFTLSSTTFDTFSMQTKYNHAEIGEHSLMGKLFESSEGSLLLLCYKMIS